MILPFIVDSGNWYEKTIAPGPARANVVRAGAGSGPEGGSSVRERARRGMRVRKAREARERERKSEGKIEREAREAREEIEKWGKRENKGNR